MHDVVGVAQSAVEVASGGAMQRGALAHGHCVTWRALSLHEESFNLVSRSLPIAYDDRLS